MKVFAAIIAIWALLSGFLFKASFAHTILLLVAGIYLALPMLLLLCLWFLIGWLRTGGVSPRLRGTFFIFLIFVLALGSSWVVGKGMHRLEIWQVRSYVEKVVPLLDDYHQAQGGYPKSLDVFDAGRRPSLLQYHSIDGADGFEFSYWDKSGLMDGYRFDNESRKWLYFD